MAKYEYKVKGVDYVVEIQDIEGNIANVTVNGIPFEVEMKQPVKSSKQKVKLTDGQNNISASSVASAGSAAGSSSAASSDSASSSKQATPAAGKPVVAPLPGTIKSCYNTASVSGQNSVGGVSGYNYGGTIKSCYNTASVSGQYSVGGVCGDNYEGPITNCYYLSGTVADGKGGIGGKDDENGKAVEMSKDRFKSGEVAWLLNGSKSVSTEESTLAWYQKLGENADAYPVLTSTGDNTVYGGYQHGSRVRFFSNTVQHSTGECKLNCVKLQ